VVVPSIVVGLAAVVVVSESVVVALPRFAVVMSIVVVVFSADVSKMVVVVVSSANAVVIIVAALPRVLALPRTLPKALPNASLARGPSVVVENVVVVSAAAVVVVVSEQTSSVLQIVSKQLDSMTMLEDKLLLEVEEITETGDELEESDFEIDNKEDKELEEIGPATELECAEDELEDRDSNSELELVDDEKLRIEEGEDVEDNFELLEELDDE